MDNLLLALMSGVDIPIPECQLTVHQPTIKEIAQIGEKEYFMGMQCLCVNKYMDKNDLKDVSEFQIFMTIMTDREDPSKRKNVMNSLFILFPNYKIHATPRALSFNLNGENIIIDESNFSSLQEVLRQISCLGGKSEDDFNPVNDAAAEIARKLQRGRQRVAAQKQGAETSSVFSQYLSILSVALHISMRELLCYTVYQLYDILERYTLFVNWDMDIRQRLAGGQPDSQPDN